MSWSLSIDFGTSITAAAIAHEKYAPAAVKRSHRPGHTPTSAQATGGVGILALMRARSTRTTICLPSGHRNQFDLLINCQPPSPSSGGGHVGRRTCRETDRGRAEARYVFQLPLEVRLGRAPPFPAVIATSGWTRTMPTKTDPNVGAHGVPLGHLNPDRLWTPAGRDRADLE